MAKIKVMRPDPGKVMVQRTTILKQDPRVHNGTSKFINFSRSVCKVVSDYHIGEQRKGVSPLPAFAKKLITTQYEREKLPFKNGAFFSFYHWRGISIQFETHSERVPTQNETPFSLSRPSIGAPMGYHSIYKGAPRIEDYPIEFLIPFRVTEVDLGDFRVNEFWEDDC